jgi:predicted membrane protein
MKENEKNLFYRVLSNNIKEEPSQELVLDIMHTVHKTVKKRIMTNKILEVLGYSLLGILSLGFVCIYLFFYTDFTLPALHISFVMPSKIYIIMISIIFCFSLIQLYFRQRLYKNC